MTRSGFPMAALTLGGALLALASAVPAAEVDVKKLPLPAPRKVDFEKEIYPLFKESCFSCHGPEKQKGKYRLDTKEGAFKKGDDGPHIIPGNSEKSPLIHMVAGLIDEGLMPPPDDKGKSQPLTKEQIGLLRAWIDQGANWPEGTIKEFVKELTFARDIQPILKTACVECHGEAQPKGGFRADSREAVLKGGKNYGAAVLPNNTAKSPLLIIAAGKDEDIAVPERHKLGDKQVELLKKWITQGAK